MSALKNELIMQAAEDIVKYLDEKYAIDVDIYHIAEFINLNVGFVFTAVDEGIKQELEKHEKNIVERSDRTDSF